MKKRIIIAIGLTVALSMTGCASYEINQTKTETTVELGSECTIAPTDYFELGSKVNLDTITVDTSSVDINNIGNYTAVITYKDNTYEIQVSVSDTTSPEITVKPDIEGVDRGTTIYPADYVEVNDLSEVVVYFVAEDGDTSSLEIPSDLDASITEINYTIVAVDTANNRSEELTITVPINEIIIETTPDDSASTTVNKNATEKEQLENKSDLTLEEELRLAQLKYEAGEIPEEDYKEYKEALEYFINKQNNQSQSEPEVIMPEGALELTPAGPDENFEMQHFESGAGVQIQ